MGLACRVTAADIEGVAMAYSQCQQIGAAIEAVRPGSKAAINAVESAMDAQNALDALIWPQGLPA